MSAAPTYPLSNIVDVVVQVTPTAPAIPTFNQGLIISPNVTGAVTNAQRLIQVTSASEAEQAGVPSSSDAYECLELYFGQDEVPQYGWVGLQDLTAVIAVAIGSAAGTGYAVGDKGTISGGTSPAHYIILAETSGIPSSVGIIGYSTGTGYTANTNVATTATTGVGSGLTLNTTVGETPLIAAQQCRQTNSQWYAFMSTTAVTADHEAIAAWVQSATPASFYLYCTQDANATNGSSTADIFSVLKALDYNRVVGIYSTTQSGAAPNNVYAAAALMGVMMGYNTGLANSFFTLAYKQLVGIVPEPLLSGSVAVISGNPGSGTGKNGNVYITAGNAYTLALPGVMPNGNFADVTLNTDMLSSDIQYSEVTLLASNPSVPQTDPGEVSLIQQVNNAAQRAVTRGFIAPGTWQGQSIVLSTKALYAGTYLPAGFLAMADTYAVQSNTARQNRQAMPIYLALVTAGAVQYLLVAVLVNT